MECGTGTESGICLETQRDYRFHHWGRFEYSFLSRRQSAAGNIGFDFDFDFVDAAVVEVEVAVVATVAAVVAVEVADDAVRISMESHAPVLAPLYSDPRSPVCCAVVAFGCWSTADPSESWRVGSSLVSWAWMPTQMARG
jgi:hypothetical protein